jgi:alpha-N-arabinofuranosidase
MDGISHHYYTIPSGVWAKKGNSTGFPEEEWISTLSRTMLIDDYLTANEAVLDEHDPEGRIGIYLDEWGTWYDPEEGHEPGFLYQQNSIRDAVVAALNFNIFHRHTARLHMANIAQTVNVLQAVVLTEGDKIVRTPTYYAFEMYKPFKDATFVPVELEAMGEYTLGEYSVPRVSATAALTVSSSWALSISTPPSRSTSHSTSRASPPPRRAGACWPATRSTRTTRSRVRTWWCPVRSP